MQMTCTYVEQPTYSLPNLLQSIKEFGQLAGFKVNFNKTQLLSYNYTPPQEIQNRYPLDWQNDHYKYLGITISKDLEKPFEYIYTPIHKRIKEDIPRWNLTPYLVLVLQLTQLKLMYCLDYYIFFSSITN